MVEDCTGLLGPSEVAGLLGVERGTVHAWSSRGTLPAPSCVVSGVPLWERDVIVGWAKKTGRMDAAGTPRRLMSGKGTP